jgi:perosamine synthetase
MKIPFGKPNLGREEKNLVSKVLNSPILTHGNISKKFEEKFSKKFKIPYATTVSSCTSALFLSYLAINIKKNDEIIVPNQTHVSTVHACEILGAKPVFIDSDNTTGNIDVEKIEKKITKKTKAITIVHFLGKSINMDKILYLKKKYKLCLIEDCALSIGSKFKKNYVGSFGDFSCFSFYPTKHITTADGGMLCCKKKEDFKKIKLLKGFGVNKNFQERKIPGNYDVNLVGLNFRMDEIRSSLGLYQLDKLDRFIKLRKKNFLYLKKNISKIPGLNILNSDCEKHIKSSYYSICIILKNKFKRKRFQIIKKLNQRGIGTSIHYPKIVSDYNYYKKKYNLNNNKFLNASNISYNSFNLPIGPHLTKKNLEYIVYTLKKIIIEIN